MIKAIRNLVFYFKHKWLLVLTLLVTITLLFYYTHNLNLELILPLTYGMNDLTLLSSTGVRTSASYWKAVWQRDPNTQTKNPHLLAARISSENREITVDDINTILKHQDISISEEELRELLNVPAVVIGVLQQAVNKERLNSIVPSVTTPRTKVNTVQPITQFGVYCWTNTETGAQYFGSSIDLGARVRYYLRVYSKDAKLRPILNDIRLHGMDKFILTVWILPEHLATVSNTVVLEQYFILSMVPSNNSLLVANASPGGKWVAELNSKSMSVPVYLYDMGNLIFKFDSTSGQNSNVVTGTGLYLKEIRVLISSGEPYLGRFVLTRTPLMPEHEDFLNTLTMGEVKQLIEDHKLVVPVRRGRPKPTTPALTIQRASSGEIYEFENVRSARTWLSKMEGQEVHQDTIMRRLEQGNTNPHRGFIYSKK